MRRIFYYFVVLSVTIVLYFYLKPSPNFETGTVAFVILGSLIALGFSDILQKKQSIRRNFPLIGHFRYLLEEIRPEIQQYFIETNDDGKPFSRETRSLIYQRAKRETETVPFGTQLDVYGVGYEWINHSLVPKEIPEVFPRIKIGEKTCAKPYDASILNVSAMSFGSLSKNAILALNRGAKIGGFSHNTGEGGLSPYHLEPGGDLVWQIGTGYFSCRDKTGKFSPELYTENSKIPQVKMIEIKLSQGAKPSHGGILPAAKLTKEIATIRGVEMGKDVVSPPSHSAFQTPIELLEFITKLRELSGGKPVGMKFCVGKKREFFSICKAMQKTGMQPDFITVDGAEGGTGAAPLEFTNSVGTPLVEGLIFVHNALVGTGLREKLKVICSGKIVSGFHIVNKVALGADLCNSARAMMIAVGCIQALRCNTNKCPTGVATQNPALIKGLDVMDKSARVAQYQKSTVKSFYEVLTAAGMERPEDLRPWHILRRTGSNQVKSYGELYSYLDSDSSFCG